MYIPVKLSPERTDVFLPNGSDCVQCFSFLSPGDCWFGLWHWRSVCIFRNFIHQNDISFTVYTVKFLKLSSLSMLWSVFTAHFFVFDEFILWMYHTFLICLLMVIWVILSFKLLESKLLWTFVMSLGRYILYTSVLKL